MNAAAKSSGSKSQSSSTTFSPTDLFLQGSHILETANRIANRVSAASVEAGAAGASHATARGPVDVTAKLAGVSHQPLDVGNLHTSSRVLSFTP
jgi:hypothetical protein